MTADGAKIIHGAIEEGKDDNEGERSNKEGESGRGTRGNQDGARRDAPCPVVRWEAADCVVRWEAADSVMWWEAADSVVRWEPLITPCERGADDTKAAGCRRCRAGTPPRLRIRGN